MRPAAIAPILINVDKLVDMIPKEDVLKASLSGGL